MSVQAICRHCGNTGVAWDTHDFCRCAMGRAAAQMLSRGKCRACGHHISAHETAVAWHGHRFVDGLPQDHVSLLGVTHTGMCAEIYSEGEGDDASSREIKPGEVIA